MDAIILAGGAGTRLRPLTYARRKELIPLLDVPLLQYRFENLRAHGVTEIVMACSQGAGEIEQHFGDGAPFGVRLRYVYEERPLGSGRAVKEAARAAAVSGTIAVCNGDILTDVDLTAMLARHRDTGATLSISLAAVDDPWHFGVVAVDGDMRISHFVEKPPQGSEPSDLINAGTWLWEPEMLDRIPDDDSAVRDGFAERVLFPGAIADGRRVQGFEERLWVDVGAPDRYFRATRLLLEDAQSHGRTLCAASAAIDPAAQIDGLVHVGERVRVEAGARIIGPAAIGRDAVIGADATVEGSVLWEGAQVGRGAIVRDSIVAARGIIGERAHVTNSILADGARIEEGAVVDGASVMPGDAVPA